MGLFLTFLVSAITFGADYLDVKRQQAVIAQEQAAALVTRIDVVNGELRAAGAFLEEANRALFRFDEYIRRLSGTADDHTNWAVLATADPQKLIQFKNWQKEQINSVDNRNIEPSSTNVIILASGSQNVLVPGKPINLPNHIADSKGPTPVSSGELSLDGSPDVLWLVLTSQPAEVQIMNGVKTLITLRRVDIGRLRSFAGLSPLQKLNVEWTKAVGGGEPRQLGATDIDVTNRISKLMTVGDYKLGFAIDNPPLPRLPRTWLLMFLVGTASTAFWVAWRAAGTPGKSRGPDKWQIASDP
jgi:hypothetical protein